MLFRSQNSHKLSQLNKKSHGKHAAPQHLAKQSKKSHKKDLQGLNTFAVADAFGGLDVVSDGLGAWGYGAGFGGAYGGWGGAAPYAGYAGDWGYGAGVGAWGAAPYGLGFEGRGYAGLGGVYGGFEGRAGLGYGAEFAAPYAGLGYEGLGGYGLGGYGGVGGWGAEYPVVGAYGGYGEGLYGGAAPFGAFAPFDAYASTAPWGLETAAYGFEGAYPYAGAYGFEGRGYGASPYAGYAGFW